MYDVLIVGAGPAGAMAAWELAGQGASVLIVDKAAFPRDKVCGCCLNRTALGVLEQAGLGQFIARLNAPQLNLLHITDGRRTATAALPGGVALSRSAFDQALVQQAVQRGAAFRDNTHAALLEHASACPHVALRSGSEHWTVQARVLIVADGLGGHLLDQHSAFATRIASRGRIGLGAIADDHGASYRPGVIYMTCAPGGYLGLVRLEDERLNMAAAVDPAFLRRVGTASGAVAQLLERARWPAPRDLPRLVWRGTPTLMRTRRPAAAGRIFLVGDSLGYVEPFTGEGMAWALASGRAVAKPAFQAITHDSPALALQWDRTAGRLLRVGHWRCRMVAWALRRPRLVNSALRWADWAPHAAGRIAANFSRLDAARATAACHSL